MILKIETTDEHEAKQLVRAKEMAWLLSGFSNWLRNQAKHHPETTAEDIWEHFREMVTEEELWNVIE